MPQADHIDQFIRLFCAGVAMVLLGGVNLLMSRARVRSRVVASAAVVGVVLAGYALWESNAGALGGVAAVVGVALVPVLVLGSRRFVAFGTELLRVVNKPATRWGLLTAGGIAVVTLGGVNFSRSEDRAHDYQMSELDMLVRRPDLDVVERVPAKTDRGYDVVVRGPHVTRGQEEIDDPEGKVLRDMKYEQFIIRRSPATDTTNCHGWVFTGGRYWIDGGSVEQILRDNNYAAVTDPRPGDLAIYRNDHGPSHTAVVRYVGDGMSTLVEGKWSWMGVFLHPVEKSAYGTDFTYYRSPRTGHLLAGVESPAVTHAAAPDEAR